MSDKQPEVPRPTLQPQENITQAQVTHLLNMFIPTCNFLIASHNDADREGGPMDGGVVTAVEATVINICNRFDSLLADDSRWSLATHASLESSFKQVYTEHARMLAEQANAYAEINTPHHKLKPALIKIPEGSWIAYLGSLDRLEEAIVGVGNCPADAIAAFDAMFSGEVPEKLQAWLSARGVNLTNNENTQQTNEKQPLDTERNLDAEKPKSRRHIRRRNGPKAGPDDEVSGS